MTRINRRQTNALTKSRLCHCDDTHVSVTPPSLCCNEAEEKEEEEEDEEEEEEDEEAMMVVRRTWTRTRNMKRMRLDKIHM